MNSSLLSSATQRGTTPFDYVIVGSGAGGGPLAARLAQGGKRVLVVEAGQDPALQKSKDFPDAKPGEVHDIPGYHSAATEDKEMSWQFSVRHYLDDARQKLDEKYNRLNTSINGASYPPDPRFLDAPGHPRGKRGVFYPRSSGIGGCTAHHAMIVVAPNDKDWDYIANATGDDSWRASKMRGYFTKLEDCLYLDAYGTAIRKLLGVFYYIWRLFAFLLSPRSVLDEGGHGRSGWQPTSFIDPNLVDQIVQKDRNFFQVLARTASSVLHRDRQLVAFLKQVLFRFRLVAQIDPNDQNTRRLSPEGVFLIPTGIAGKVNTSEGKGMTGRRMGVREFLLNTMKEYPDNLVIATGYHVTRVLFEKDDDGIPRAIGVEAAPGDHLYEASPLQKKPPTERVQFFTRGEVILCGGAFNTPQLLMLSGIGEQGHLAEIGIRGLPGTDGQLIAPVVNLRGVGRNLQDRYEVSVISELDADLPTLKNVTFTPGDPQDEARREWFESQSGLYAGNGGTLAILKRSAALKANEPEPDLFIFGAPAAFRGYYWGWSRELFHRTTGAPRDERKLWSWVILKAYTQNQDGFVRLRTHDPFDQPEICFDSFNELAEARARDIERQRKNMTDAGQPIPQQLLNLEVANNLVLEYSQRDLTGLVDAIKTVRAINARNPKQFITEVQPGPNIADDSPALREWIRTQAWGHHASCTCRMGSDPWTSDPSKLTDTLAVLDSRFRVHGVRALRVVDTSAFPKIPGYFILAPTLMLSEKAADTFLQDQQDLAYPRALREAEMAAVQRRRRIAHGLAAGPGGVTGPAGVAAASNTGGVPTRAAMAPVTGTRPEATVGLALSGGGIRSATFCLGVLQAFAERNRLRYIDFLSTVSGGAFTGSFLGRLFTRRMVTEATDPAGRVQEIVRDEASAPLCWLRSQANYILGGGSVDLQQNLAIYFRNVFTVHLVVGALLFAVFGLAHWLGDRLPVPQLRPLNIGEYPLELSPWWWLPLAVAVLGIVPGALGYWLAPKPKWRYPHPFFALLVWSILMAACIVVLGLPGGILYAVFGAVILTATWAWQEVARWGYRPETGQQGVVVRNRLTRSLGEVLVIFALAIGWVVLDTLARSGANRGWADNVAMILVALAPVLPMLRWLAQVVRSRITKQGGAPAWTPLIGLIAVALAVFLLFIIDLWVHNLFTYNERWAWYAIGITLAFSFAVGQALSFLNQSSLHASYSARLTRTFQGASNEARVYSAGTNPARDVQLTHPDDDLPFHEYHPEEKGGPLHLIGVCVNETVDNASQREIRERKGLLMCLGPKGVSVGRRFHALWSLPKPRTLSDRMRSKGQVLNGALPPTALHPIRASNDPDGFHVFASRNGGPAVVEPLSLGAWTGISGAAFGTGEGRKTTRGLALLLGLVNLRLGYWWNSGISAAYRPGRYPASLWRVLKELPSLLFRMQGLLLSEWRALFPGPSRRYWYLSDGGHFDNTALYELLRRRVDFIICSDAGADPDYRWGDLAELARQVRVDFGAEITWMPCPTAQNPSEAPAWIQDWINLNALSDFKDIKSGGSANASLARVRYLGGPSTESWILLLKPCLTGEEPFDLRNYQADNPDFPQQPTIQQFFDDAQWESYRALGRCTGRQILRSDERSDDGKVALK